MLKGLTSFEIALMGILVVIGLIVSHYYGGYLFQKAPNSNFSSSLTYVEIPCSSYASCKSMLTNAGIPEEKIGELGLKCINDKCYVKGYFERAWVRK